MIEQNKVKTDVEYSHPETLVVNISLSGHILTGSDFSLENPEEGDDWGWDY